ncbi:hypothetical protein [Spongiactinospora sp. 9N601]|uniref:hypothetical protein n=1 Tax=Spongiactinospora sp. 9N601 TaxID=3375149 RepID=UPI0037989D5D
MTSDPDGPDREVSARHLWIVGAVTGAAVVAVAAAALWPQIQGASAPAADRTAATSARPSAAPTAPATPPPAATTAPPGTAAPSAVPSTVPTTAPPRPRVRWRGQVTISGPRAWTDLDADPPHIARAGGDINGDWLTASLRAATPGVRLAVIDPAAEPGRRACEQQLASGGLDRLERVRAGDAVCVLTDARRVALLRITHAAQTSGRPIIQATVTVWDPPPVDAGAGP